MAEKIKYVSFGDLTELDKKNQQDLVDGHEELEVASHPQQKVASSGQPPLDRPSSMTATSRRPPERIAGHQIQDVDGHHIPAASHQMIKVDGHRKGDRHAKNKVKVTIRHNQDIYNEIKEFCSNHNLQVQDFYELAASHYMNQVDGHQLASKTATMVASRPAHDDLMIFKSDDNIIMLFKKMTGRKWTASDDRAAAAFNSVDRRLVEIGMIHTVIQSRGKRINSFKYFVPEIQTIMDAGFDRSNLDVYLKARRKMLNEWLVKQGMERIY